MTDGRVVAEWPWPGRAGPAAEAVADFLTSPIRPHDAEFRAAWAELRAAEAGPDRLDTLKVDHAARMRND